MHNVRTGAPVGADPSMINWRQRQDRAVVPFEVDDNYLPVNPCPEQHPEGLAFGCGSLDHWGEATAADAVVFWTHPESGRRWLLMIERGDDGTWALPGGGLDEGEDARTAVARELAEETGLELAEDAFSMMPGRYVPDPRAGLNAWMVTFPGRAEVGGDTPPAVEGRDDARRALWMPADSYVGLFTMVALRGRGYGGAGGRVFPSHRALLRELLNG